MNNFSGDDCDDVFIDESQQLQTEPKDTVESACLKRRGHVIDFG